MFILNPGSGIPIYRQLVEQIRRLVAGGQLQPGDCLPSVRELASTHAVNPMTISKAYNQLEAEGILVRRRGRPMEVAARPTQADTPGQLLEPQLDELIQAARQLGVEVDTLPELLDDYLRQLRKEKSS
ncbi:GntR family transcriptional regulator [Gilvimarinus algae]|uniref:GntR family transcriptional regulator n=1 Tax=Gilvimarinus algae TaxID=3058037 RepID=A0ABT8TIQ1_9GAMM|nr:GntR family transcriptional regulator [Gilvimarinus sp. SDUM040014]MDO3383811.1 GntR family transcriptional regulator [Gilvimarinus sp. SDUM040014]